MFKIYPIFNILGGCSVLLIGHEIHSRRVLKDFLSYTFEEPNKDKYNVLNLIFESLFVTTGILLCVSGVNSFIKNH